MAEPDTDPNATPEPLAPGQSRFPRIETPNPRNLAPARQTPTQDFGPTPAVPGVPLPATPVTPPPPTLGS